MVQTREDAWLDLDNHCEWRRRVLHTQDAGTSHRPSIRMHDAVTALEARS